MSQLQIFHKAQLFKQAYFLIDGKYTFEVGGKRNQQKTN